MDIPVATLDVFFLTGSKKRSLCRLLYLEQPLRRQLFSQLACLGKQVGMLVGIADTVKRTMYPTDALGLQKAEHGLKGLHGVDATRVVQVGITVS